MGRLHGIILLTPELERQKAFYADRLGLKVTHDAPEWVGFALRGASLALRAASAGTAPEMQLAIVAASLETKVAALQARGIALEGGIDDGPDGRFARLRDPEGNRVRLVEPKTGGAEGHWPRLSHAIVSAERFASTVHFYREVLGLRVAEEREGWVEFDTGPTHLAIQDRADADSLPLHAEQKVAFAFEDDDFDAWAEELRARGVSFAAAPMEVELGVQAEVEDADGWFVVLQGPAPDDPIEDELAADFVDDDEPRQRTQQIRRPGESGGESTKRRLTAAKIARKTSERAATKSFETPRGREGDAAPGGFGGGAPGPRPSGPPRPGGFSGPRPGGPSGPPRPGGFGGPRPGGPSGPPRPGGFGGPRPGGPSGPPRPGGFGGPRPGGPRPGGPPRGGGSGSGGGSGA